MEKNEAGSLPLTLPKTDLLMDHGSQQRPKTLNLIEGKLASTLELISTEKGLLNRRPIAQALIQTINEWDFSKFKALIQQRVPPSSEEAACRMEIKLVPATHLTKVKIQNMQRFQKINIKKVIHLENSTWD